jgi:endonuclease/exonuclease/phosphatase family metal-dependent hydrolase
MTNATEKTRSNSKSIRIWIGLTVVAFAAIIWSGAVPTATGAGSRVDTLSSSTRPTGPAILRVATFNVASGVGRDGHRQFARTAEALKGFDIAGLQEVSDHLAARGEMMRTVGDSVGRPWLFAPVEKQWWGLKWFGNGLLCDLPVAQTIVLPTSSSQSRTNRNVILARALWQGQPINVMVTHLDRHEDHDQELGEIIALFNSLESPVILLGDLNTTRRDPQLTRLREEPGVVDCLTEHSARIVAEDNVDWIFLRGLACTEASFSDNGASDHHLASATVTRDR